MLRHYKPIATRLRPTDRMVAHTGYLIFARPVTAEVAGEMFAEEPVSAVEPPQEQEE
jgi:tRNA (adenine57-N1/adenine58-N1)-methyltransferase